jgi:hypothetical protein
MPRMFWKRKKNSAANEPPGANTLVGRPLGQILIKMGRVTSADVVEALTFQRSKGGMLGEVLVDLGRVSVEDVEAALAAQRGEGS